MGTEFYLEENICVHCFAMGDNSELYLEENTYAHCFAMGDNGDWILP